MSIRRRQVRQAEEIRRGTRQAGQPVAPMEDLDSERLIAADDLGTDLRMSLRDAIAAESEDADDDEPPVLLMYQTQADERVRPHHAALHGTVWRADDPERPNPPLGFGCRCYMEPVAADAASARATGLPQAPKNPPEPFSGEAMQQFLSDAEGSPQSDDPGRSVTPQDLFGPRVGRLVEQGKIDIAATIDEDGNQVPETILRGAAAAGGSQRVVAAAMRAAARAQGMGISLQQMRSLVAAAQELARSESLEIREALIRVIIRERPGFIGARSDSATRRRAEVAARHILAVYRGL